MICAISSAGCAYQDFNINAFAVTLSAKNLKNLKNRLKISSVAYINYTHNT